jgi:hypothetical protein
VNETELEKCKNDPAYFAEKYLGLELLSWQKTYLKLITKYKHVCFVGHRNGRSMIEETMRKHEEMFK